ncbi:MAG: hypothetical protein QME75_10035 [Deltaproteobacteria bacterium]|nr:hypothetical protein [Deltaproteobacteria bacterium]
MKVARAALEAETQEVVRTSKNLNENLGKAVKSIWRQLLFLWAIVAILAISYLWVLKSTPKAINLVEAPQAQSMQGKLLPPATPAPQTPDPASIPAGEDLIKLLNQIREAQLKKDIQLFLKAYSSDFVNLKQKKDLTLNIWRRYDYIDLQYQLSNVIQEDDSTILALVTWDIKARDHKTDDVKLLTKSYKVQFFRESSGNWLVQKLEPVDENELET